MRSVLKMLSLQKMQKKIAFLTKPKNMTKVMLLVAFFIILFVFHKYFLTKEGFESSPEELEDVVSSKKSMVLFHADWCGYCKKFMPTWDSLSSKWNENQDAVQFVKVDCGNPKENPSHREIMDKYNIKGYPTIYVFEGGNGTEYTNGREVSDIESFLGLK